MKLIEVTDNRPLIWRLVASLKANGKAVSYYAYLPDWPQHVKGYIESVGSEKFSLWIPYKKNQLPSVFPFTEKDDENLTLIPALDDHNADFTIVNANETH